MPPAIDEWIKKLTEGDDATRTSAWFEASVLGAPAVTALAAIMTAADREVARAAKNGLWRIIRFAGRPGAARERRAVAGELLTLLAADQPTPVRREALWMLSEVGDDTAVDPLAELLGTKDLREDARCALERMPGQKPVAALQRALAAAPEDFKPNLTQSLRARGISVPGSAADRK